MFAARVLLLVDHTYDHTYDTVLHPFSVVVCTECIVAKWCILEQNLLLTAYRKSYIRNLLVPK